MLCLLEGETNPGTFTERLEQFIIYWTPREPHFMKYFSQHYANRPGTLYVLCIMYTHIRVHVNIKFNIMYVCI